MCARIFVRVAQPSDLFAQVRFSAGGKLPRRAIGHVDRTPLEMRALSPKPLLTRPLVNLSLFTPFEDKTVFMDFSHPTLAHLARNEEAREAPPTRMTRQNRHVLGAHRYRARDKFRDRDFSRRLPGLRFLLRRAPFAFRLFVSCLNANKRQGRRARCLFRLSMQPWLGKRDSNFPLVYKCGALNLDKCARKANKAF